MSEPKLPVHGFVLAGGRSSRMGVDKATLKFCGRPLVAIAVEKLRTFCAEVSIAGNREDLSAFAPVVRETRMDAGPAAGVEAALLASTQPWAMFIPVDVPLVPASLLRRWAQLGLRLRGDGVAGSRLHAGAHQPAFCLLNRDCAATFTASLDAGERRLRLLLQQATAGFERVLDVSELYADEPSPSQETIERWFLNLNMPEELQIAEALAQAIPTEN